MTTTQALAADQIARAESAIRDQAANVITAVQARRDHPTYGYSKTDIRHRLAVLNGAVGLYMVLTDQANHVTVPTLCDFTERETAERVETARVLVATL